MSRARWALIAAWLVAGVPAPPGAAAQCILANPSFELPGTGGAVFGGWNQFGASTSSASATHGNLAARVTGPNSGGWGLSAFWQRLDTTPGERWSASVQVRTSGAQPLTGASQAIVNIEWRDAANNLISFESHVVADASTPPDVAQRVTVSSQPAPAGAVATHLLLGTLQAPGEPAPEILFDEATFLELTPPTLDDLQWGDFPGGSTLDFSGRIWRVKGPGLYGPGPNLFSDAPTATWVDANGRLHMTIRDVAGSWYSTEVVLEEALGYGDYIFTTLGRLDTLDPNAVLGLFLWQYAPCYDPAQSWWAPYNEIDVEFSRWGVPGNDVGQFVAQPWDFPGNIERFAATFSPGERTSHAFRWWPDRVEFRSWRGGPADDTVANRIHEWTYAGFHIPRPEQPRVHVNLWHVFAPPATDQEVVLDEFRFVPLGGAVDVPAPRPMDNLVTRFSAVQPNPFRNSTTIRYALPAAGAVEITVHDVAGRLVRRLENRRAVAGDHQAFWNGHDEAGRPTAAGVYMVRFRSGAITEAHRVVRVR